MLGGVTTQRDSLLWTLEEISHLVSNSGHPDETLRNIVELIQRTFDTDVCSVYLLEPDRATLVLAATVGLAARQRRTGAHAADRRPGRPGRRAADAAGRRRRNRAPALQVLQRSGRRPVSLVPRRPADRQRPAARRARRPDDRAARVRARRRADADDGRRAAGVDREPRAHAGTIRRARPSPAGSARAEHVVELGSRHGEPLPGDRSHALARARSQSDRAAPADFRRQARRAGVRARPAQPHQLRVPPHAGAPDVDAHLGCPKRGRALGASGRVLLRRVRAARVGSDLLGRPRHPRRRSHQIGVGSRNPARRHRPFLRPGLLHAALRS